uniref:Uncharacterized protein n=1 Tax=Zea mays TaxID=4577 RepID=C4J796_MAIZE|nr:unknown [Zea mays]
MPLNCDERLLMPGGYCAVVAAPTAAAAAGFGAGGCGWWETTSGGLGARLSASACFRALYISSVSTATRRFTWVSIPRSDGVVRCSTVRWQRRRRMASSVRRWRRRVPGRPRTSVMYSRRLTPPAPAT